MSHSKFPSSTEGEFGAGIAAVTFRIPALAGIGFGGAPIGNLYAPVSDDEAVAAVVAAYDAGIRYFDTAPYYGFGLSESRLGQALQGRPRDAYRLSTKVGRRLCDDESDAATASGFAVSGRNAVFDYSHDGVLRSFETSLQRLGVDRVDILLLHDIGRRTHGDQHHRMLRLALGEALPTMAELKAQGACGAIGIGVNEVEVVEELMPLFDFDCVMLAGRYTLLEQALDFMNLAQRRGIAVLAAGPYNSGLLGRAGEPGATYDYAPVGFELRQRVERLYAICAEHGVDTGAAALQFAAAHPAVASVVTGLRNTDEVASAVERMRVRLPAALWDALRREGWLDAGVPTP